MQDAFPFDDMDDDADGVRADSSGARAPTGEIGLEAALDAAAGGAVIATVNRRLARHLTEAFVRRRVAAGDAWWDTPAIMPLGNWLDTWHDAALASGASTRVRLAPLAARRRWRSVVATRHAHLLDVDAAAREAARAWRLAHSWHCPPDDDAYLSSDAHAFRGWARAYAESLEQEGLVDEAGLLAHLVALLADGSAPPADAIVVAGFLQPPPALLTLCEALADVGVSVVWLGDGADAATPVRTLWPNDTDELRAVADAVCRAVQGQPDGLFGVVVPNLEARRSEVRRAFDRRFFPALSPLEIERIERPYDVSVGDALSDTPVVRTALLALRLAWHQLDRQEISTLLLSPHLGGASSEAREREALERKLREWRVRKLDFSRLRKRLGDNSMLLAPLEALGKRIGAERRDGREAAPLGIWAERFSQALAAFGWPGEGLGSEEFQAVQALHGVLDDLQTLDDGEAAGPFAAWSDLSRLARERVFQPETPAVPIRILGRLESHGQRFDRLWVVGLDSDGWPAAAAPSPFLSVADQRTAGMPEASADARRALAQRELAHWCGSAGAVSLSGARERDGQLLVPSFALEGAAPGTFDDSAFDPAARVRDAAVLERIDDPRGPPVAPGDRVRGGASLFRDQAECPFRAFATHRLGLRALEEVDIGLDPRQSGNVLHKALEVFWTETGSHAGLMALGVDALEGRIRASVEQALAEDTFMEPTVARLEQPRVEALLTEWIDGHEMNREPFTVESTEQELHLEYGGIAVRLFIDRIDVVGERRVVVDYKSGRSDTIKTWADERIANPQLPMYALSDPGIDGVAFARIARGDYRFIGIAAEEGVLPGVGTSTPDDDAPDDWDGWRTHWQRSLDAIAVEIADGYAGVLPVKDACRYCALTPVCRFRADLSEDDVEGIGEAMP